MKNKDHSIFTEVCARTAYTELCRLKGDAHADTLSCLATLAVHLSKQGKIDEARECFTKCCEGRAATLGEDCEETLSIQESFADLLKEQQEYDAARTLLLKCLDCRLKVPGPHHQRTLRTQFRLAEIELCADAASEVCSAASRLKELLKECVSRGAVVEAVNIRYFPSIVRLLSSSYGSVGLDCAMCIAYVATFPENCASVVKLLRNASACAENGDGAYFVPIFAILNSKQSRMQTILPVCEKW